jgi:hypothetical protein
MAGRWWKTPAVSAPCPTCGFDADSLSPPDAVVALRSLSRRFREAAEAGRQSPDGAEAVPAEDVLRAASVAAATIAEVGEQLRLVLVEDTPALPDPSGPTPGDPATAADRLTAAATSLADLAAAQPATAWQRTGRRGSVTVSAADLLREAVHAGIHQLRLVTGRGDEED